LYGWSWTLNKVQSPASSAAGPAYDRVRLLCAGGTNTPKQQVVTVSGMPPLDGIVCVKDYMIQTICLPADGRTIAGWRGRPTPCQRAWLGAGPWWFRGYVKAADAVTDGLPGGTAATMCVRRRSRRARAPAALAARAGH